MDNHTLVQKTNTAAGPSSLSDDKTKWIIYWCLVGVMIAFRIWCGMVCGNQYYPKETFDDKLMFDYAQLRTHFHNFNYLSLAKTMSYPLFLDACYALHINYTLALSLIWCIAALLFSLLIWKLFRNRLISFAFFTYVLFIPTAFDYYFGGRIYRNSIITPFTVMTFSLIFLNIYNAVKRRQTPHRLMTVLVSVFAGFVFTYTYYIKEDGLWLLASLGFFSLVTSVILLIRLLRKKSILKKTIFHIFMLFLPFLIFAAGTEAYKEINYHYFGVREIQTRTEGEPGRFVKNLYSMDAKGRSNYVWTPEDAIAQAIAVSPTLQSRPDLIDNLYVNPWAVDLKQDPYYGDHLTWGLRYAMSQHALYDSEQQAADFLGRVNDEIEAAYADGRLKKSDRFQILSSAGGFSREEFPELLHICKHSFLGAVFIKDYTPCDVAGGTEDPEARAVAIRMTHLSYLNDYANRTPENIALADNLCNGIFRIYRVINPILLILSVLVFLWLLIHAIYQAVKKKNRHTSQKEFLYAGTLFVLMGIALAYALAISWFSCFIFKDGINQEILNFYSVGLPAILAILYGFAIGNLLSTVHGIRKSRNSLSIREAEKTGETTD